LRIMNFFSTVKTCFQKYAVFKGRASRSEFWYWYLFLLASQVVLAIPAVILSFLVMGENGVDAGISLISIIFWLAVLLPTVAALVRRFHDTGKSGYYFFIVLIPLIGGLFLIYQLCKEGDFGDNDYGADPLTGTPGHQENVREEAWKPLLFMLGVIVWQFTLNQLLDKLPKNEPPATEVQQSVNNLPAASAHLGASVGAGQNPDAAAPSGSSAPTPATSTSPEATTTQPPSAGPAVIYFPPPESPTKELVKPSETLPLPSAASITSAPPPAPAPVAPTIPAPRPVLQDKTGTITAPPHANADTSSCGHTQRVVMQFMSTILEDSNVDSIVQKNIEGVKDRLKKQGFTASLIDENHTVHPDNPYYNEHGKKLSHIVRMQISPLANFPQIENIINSNTDTLPSVQQDDMYCASSKSDDSPRALTVLLDYKASDLSMMDEKINETHEKVESLAGGAGVSKVSLNYVGRFISTGGGFSNGKVAGVTPGDYHVGIYLHFIIIGDADNFLAALKQVWGKNVWLEKPLTKAP
jgi:uncharacterized membrane protein YhaH (DUF805 family)